MKKLKFYEIKNSLKKVLLFCEIRSLIYERTKTLRKEVVYMRVM